MAQMANTWIFQSNPDRFRIGEFLSSLGGQPIDTVWLVRQHRREIAPGDTVFIWRGIGSDKKNRHLAGVVARGKVTEDVREQPDDPASQPYWIDPKDGTEVLPRVAMRIEAYTSAAALRFDAIKMNPDLSELAIMKKSRRRATNFEVTPDEAKAIDALF